MIERQIIIGIISSTEYIQQIQNIWGIDLLTSSSAKRIATWVFDYYKEFNIAPKKDIEDIFYTKVKSGKILKDDVEDIEEILQGLSVESETEINIEYLVDITSKYFRERRLQQYNENIQALITKGDLESAEKIASEYKVNFSNPKTDLNNFIVSVLQIRKHKPEVPKLLLKPWLREGQTTIIYANYGVGKSLLTLSIAYVLGLKDIDSTESEIGKWQVKNQTGCLYIDGELGEQEMEERISQFEVSIPIWCD